MRFLRRLFQRCGHANHVGLANHWHAPTSTFLQLIECRDCGAVLIVTTTGG